MAMGIRGQHSTIEGAAFFSGMLGTGFFLSPAAPEGFAGGPFLSCPFMNHFRISDDCAKKTKNETSGPTKNINRESPPHPRRISNQRKRKPGERDKSKDALTISYSRKDQIFPDPGSRFASSWRRFGRSGLGSTGRAVLASSARVEPRPTPPTGCAEGEKTRGDGGGCTAEVLGAAVGLGLGRRGEPARAFLEAGRTTGWTAGVERVAKNFVFVALLGVCLI
jgi:hypothetical protein